MTSEAPRVGAPRRTVLAGGAAAAAAALRPARAFAMTGLGGWYADPELHDFDGRWWMYATTSEAPPDATTPALSAAQTRLRQGPTVRPAYLGQTYMDAFSSPDLVNWTRHPRAIDVAHVSWAAYALWAPSVIRVGGRYAMFFGANDIQNDRQLGGLGLAWADAPRGPFRDELGRPFVGAFHNGAQPIDPFVFRDGDGQLYLFYGGWGHCNVARLAPDLSGLTPFADGSTFRSITPRGYVEGAFMIKRAGVYYFMWSEGDWTGPDYRVAYARGSSVLGPFTQGGVILRQDLRVATGAGHHSVARARRMAHRLPPPTRRRGERRPPRAGRRSPALRRPRRHPARGHDRGRAGTGPRLSGNGTAALHPSFRTSPAPGSFGACSPCSPCCSGPSTS